MKTTVLCKKVLHLYLIVMILLAGYSTVMAQAVPPQLSNGLIFQNYSHISGTHLQPGASYLFEDVAAGIDATVRIDSLVNGARIDELDDNSNGVGYRQAFQPAIRSGNVIGYSYAVFSFRFFLANTNVPALMESVNATALDIDGNPTLKEFADINMNGGNATFMSTTTDISLLQILSGRFKAENILGIERGGIDTTAYANMFTATNGGINSFTIRYGTFTIIPTNSPRQFSLYMKAFQYPFQSTLPLEMVSFTATLNKTRVDLKWVTMNEVNVNHFIIEKSYDGKNFNDAALVFAYGNTNEKKTYTYPDNVANVTSGIIYYRIRSYDEDGKTQLSETRMIRIALEKESISLVTYPNPATSELRVTIPSKWQNKSLKLELYNTNGQLVKSMVSNAANQTETIQIDRLPKGFYVVKASAGLEVAQQSIIKN